MKKPTFREQYDKIVDAYLRDELEPKNSCACFIGNLLNNSSKWVWCRDWNVKYDPIITTDSKSYLVGLRVITLESKGLYTPEEIVEMEALFLKSCGGMNWLRDNNVTEENLFKAMEVTLQLLREIHEFKGEVVEDYTFKQRKLCDL